MNFITLSSPIAYREACLITDFYEIPNPHPDPMFKKFFDLPQPPKTITCAIARAGCVTFAVTPEGVDLHDEEYEEIRDDILELAISAISDDSIGEYVVLTAENDNRDARVYFVANYCGPNEAGEPVVRLTPDEWFRVTRELCGVCGAERGSWDYTATDANGSRVACGCELETMLAPRWGKGKRPSGAPVAERRIDWTCVDFAKPNAQIAREVGCTRQTVAAQRKRHAPKD